MKKIFYFAIFIFLACGSLDEEEIKTTDEETQTEITVMSYNMLFEHTIPQETERQWVNRLPNLIESINRIKPDIIGSQELQSYQVYDIIEGTGYGRIGKTITGGTSTTDNNENEAIFYNKDSIECIKSGNFWFNDNPDSAGPASGMSYNRMCTWSQFREISSGMLFYVFNSHFYVETSELRLLCAKILTMKELEVNDQYPVFLTGDFNCTVSDEPVQYLLNSGKVKDSRSLASNPKGPTGSYYGFDLNNSPTQRIDHILVNSKIEILEYEIIDDQWQTGKIESDHLPVLVKAKF